MTSKKTAALPDQGASPDFKRRLDNHFLTCSAFAGAAALLAAPAAGAAVVYSGPKNVSVPVTGTGLSIDLDTGAFSTTEEIAGFDLNFSESRGTGLAKLNFTAGTPAADGADAVITVHKGSSSSSSSSFTTVAVNKLKAGKLISGKKKFGHAGPLGTLSSSSSSSSNAVTGAWGHGGTGYVGFRFVSAANTTLYGWAQLAVGADLQATVVDWAYEDSGQPIVAGVAQDTSVSIRAVQPTAAEGGGGALLKFVRKGDKHIPLKVHLAVDPSSTAISGVDYQALPGAIIIPAGKRAVTLPVNAISNPAKDGTLTLSLKVLPGFGYNVGGSGEATVGIADSN